MESDNESNTINILQQLSQKNKFDYLDDSSDCLTDAFLTIYESSLWCIKFFYKSLWQILLLTEKELHYNQNETVNSIDVLSMNNSANGSKKKYRELPRHQLQKSNSQHSRQKTLSKLNILSNKTRITVHSISNQNLNRVESNHMSLTEAKKPANTLGTINSHITVVPVNSSHCQNITSTNNLKQSENINLREQLADALCRRSYQPLTFINRGMCCGYCRPLFFSNLPFHQLGQHFPSITSQQEFNQKRELSQKSNQSPRMGDASETQSTPYSTSPNIQSQLTNLPDNEPLSTGTISNNETNEHNHSVLSFPEHDTSPSHESEELIDDDSQLKLKAQILVDDSIENAQEILRKSTDQDPQNNTLATVKQIIKNKSKPASISNESNIEKLSDANKLCQELCNKLNLSDSNQIAEIIRILASNAPHVLKEQFPNKDNENTLCSQLLLHPPFKPKRLIHLCPDGSIQVLSAIDENLNKNQMINPEQYHLNYSNSAISPSIQQNHTLTNESSLAFVDVQTDFNHMMLTESTSTQQSHSKNAILFDHLIRDNHPILSLEQKKTLFKYDTPLTLAKTISQNDDPVVEINLDLTDETIEGNSEDEENSLPEIFFKRIIATESFTTPLIEEKNEALNVLRKNHQKSRDNRSRSYTNKRAINRER